MSRATTYTSEDLLRVLDEVRDPEVPVLSIIELGIVRGVDITADGVVVTVTPTYSGCPAMVVIERDIVDALRAHGVDEVEVRTTFSPPWTSDWIPARAREKLRRYGIAPPGPADHDAPIAIGRRRPAVRCSYCGSADTRLQSEFGSTACKAIHTCDACHQPFEEFKPI